MFYVKVIFFPQKNLGGQGCSNVERHKCTFYFTFPEEDLDMASNFLNSLGKDLIQDDALQFFINIF